MKKTIVIVESPKKITALQKYLGEEYVVLASQGQIMDLSKGGRFGIGVNPLNGFKTSYSLIPQKVGFLDEIINQSDNIKHIIIATDPDIEGHGIAWHIARSLSHLNKPISRAEFHEITEDGFQEGMNKIGPIDENKFKAQETRRCLDRIVGFMVSPLLINHYHSKLSAGRVQSVATRLIVEKEREISNFKPEEYWNLNVKLKKEDVELSAKYTEKIKNKEQAENIKSLLEKSNSFIASSVVRKNKSELPPPPLTTAKMQQLMSSKYGIDGDKTMELAQSLYEFGFVTYIRTDSVRTSDTALAMVRSWIKDNNFDLPKKPNIFNNKNAAQNAHECVRPTKLTVTPDKINLSEEAHLLYKLIWNSFVASQMCPAVYDTLVVKLDHALSDSKFKANGKVLIDPGYLALNKNIKGGETVKIPEVKEGSEFQLLNENSINIEQKFTQPPSRFTYGSFVEELEKRGIGRPSTFTEIISKITARNYVEKRDNIFYGTKVGDDITSLLSKYFDFMEYNYTASLEEQMDEVSLGNLDSREVLSKFFDKFINKLKCLHNDTGGKTCEKCSAPMYARTSRNGVSFFGCALYPFCKSSSEKSDIEEKNNVSF